MYRIISDGGSRIRPGPGSTPFRPPEAADSPLTDQQHSDHDEGNQAKESIRYSEKTGEYGMFCLHRHVESPPAIRPPHRMPRLNEGAVEPLREPRTNQCVQHRAKEERQYYRGNPCREPTALQETRNRQASEASLCNSDKFHRMLSRVNRCQGSARRRTGSWRTARRRRIARGHQPANYRPRTLRQCGRPIALAGGKRVMPLPRAAAGEGRAAIPGRTAGVPLT